MANKRKDPKTTNLNKLPLERTTKSFDEYFDVFTFRQKPVSDAWLEQLMNEMRDFALTALVNMEEEKKGKHHYQLGQFFKRKGITSNDIRRWKETRKNFKVVYDWCLEVMGDTREVGGFLRKLDPGMVRSSMYHYDSDWKEIAQKEWEVKAKNNDVMDVNPVYHITMNNVTSRPTPEEVAGKINSKMTRGIKNYGESKKL